MRITRITNNTGAIPIKDSRAIREMHHLRLHMARRNSHTVRDNRSRIQASKLTPARHTMVTPPSVDSSLDINHHSSSHTSRHHNNLNSSHTQAINRTVLNHLHTTLHHKLRNSHSINHGRRRPLQ